MLTIGNHIKKQFSADWIKSRFHEEDWPSQAHLMTEREFQNWQMFPDTIEFCEDMDFAELEGWLHKQRNVAHSVKAEMMGWGSNTPMVNR